MFGYHGLPQDISVFFSSFFTKIRTLRSAASVLFLPMLVNFMCEQRGLRPVCVFLRDELCRFVSTINLKSMYYEEFTQWYYNYYFVFTFEWLQDKLPWDRSEKVVSMTLSGRQRGSVYASKTIFFQTDEATEPIFGSPFCSVRVCPQIGTVNNVAKIAHATKENGACLLHG